MDKDKDEEKKPSSTTRVALFMAVFMFALALILLVSTMNNKEVETKNYNNFATCIVNSGAKMYGAWWCPHCNDQKDAFGTSWKILVDGGAYVECANEDQSQNEICSNEGIQGYPTWRFSNGKELGGFLTFQMLSEETGCELI